jgi:hypothetical protein
LQLKKVLVGVDANYRRVQLNLFLPDLQPRRQYNLGRRERIIRQVV